MALAAGNSATGNAQTQLASFPSSNGQTPSFRSVLYLERTKKLGSASRMHSWTGPAAIEHYLEAEEKGRLIQSLKSYLSSRTLTGTEVFGRRYTLEELVSRMLADLRIAAEKQFGMSVLRATVGRPV